jgi:MurNAc alpha-1-phosphate uridylyltransferase
MIENAIILAAGLGTRMRPLTNDIPKPLVKVHQKSLIDYKLDVARKSGIKNIVVNVHYLADQLEEHLKNIDGIDITISDERDLLLDSGGGIFNVLNHFDNKPFLVMNSDTFWIDDSPVSLLQLFDKWDSATMDILLALADKNQAIGFHGPGDFFIKKNNCLAWRAENKTAPYAFAGDYILHPRVFQDVPEGPFSSLILFDRAMTKDRLHGVKLEGTWLDVGTPDSLIEAEQAIAQQNT